MYLIGIDAAGRWPVGNQGTLRTGYRAAYKIRELARNMKTWGAAEVFALADYPQRLCELEPREAVAYVRQHGRRICG